MSDLLLHRATWMDTKRVCSSASLPGRSRADTLTRMLPHLLTTFLQRDIIGVERDALSREDVKRCVLLKSRSTDKGGAARK